MATKKAKSKVKDPHGKDMDYKVEKLKVMTPERKAEIEAKAKDLAVFKYRKQFQVLKG